MIKNLHISTILAAAVAGTSSLAAQPLLQLGNGLSLHALASAELVFEDNVFLTPIAEQNDTILKITPGLELNLARQGAASINFKYEHIFQYYDDFSGLDRDMARLSFGMRYDSGVVLATVNASYSEFSSNDVSIANITGSRVDRDVTNVSGNVKYGISRLTAVSVGASYSDTDYDLATFTDSESVAVPVTFFYQLRPRVDLTAGIRYREVSAKQPVTGLSQDYDDLFVFVGAVGELFSPTLTADIQVGLQERDYKRINRKVDTPTYSMTLIYSGDPKVSFSAGLSRDYRVSAIDTGTYVSSIATLAAQYSVSRSVQVSSSVNFGKNDYQQSPREEDIFVFTLGGVYRANDYLSFSAGYEYHNVDGNAVNYTLNKFRIAASLRY